MGYKHDRDDILRAAMVVARAGGLTQLSFGRVAKELGISDRTVVYYFPSKEHLVTAVLLDLAAEIAALLERAFGAGPIAPADLLPRAWSALCTETADAAFAMVFEAAGLACAGIAPYPTAAAALVDAWKDWLMPRLGGTPGPGQAEHALAVIAQLDGLLLLRQINVTAADQAARHLGARTARRRLNNVHLRQ